MTGEILFMLILVAVALVAFVKEVLPLEVTALGILAVLIVSGTVTVEQALSGFEGAILAVVHDRYFIDSFATNLWVVEGKGIRREVMVA